MSDTWCSTGAGDAGESEDDAFDSWEKASNAFDTRLEACGGEGRAGPGLARRPACRD